MLQRVGRFGCLSSARAFSVVTSDRAFCKHASMRKQFVEQMEDPAKVNDFVDNLSDDSRRSLIFSLVAKEEDETGTKVDFKKIFEQADTNNDGVLSEAEFASWVQHRSWFGSSTKNTQFSNQPQEEPQNEEKPEQPNNSQVFALAIQVAIPFVGFGFLDNAIMITAGNTIEHSIGITLGLSTLAAAGLGNLMSDVAGIGLGNTIEHAAHRIGLPNPHLTRKQEQSSRVRWTRLGASVLGIAVGCILGMFPLLFVQTKEETRLRRMFDQIDENGNGEIDFEELSIAIRQLGLTVDESRLRTFFEFIDIDGDGVINFEEFCYLVQHIQAMLDPKVKKPSLPHVKHE